MPDHLPGPISVAGTFLAAYVAGDKAAILALCAPDAVAEYVPWGDEGLNLVVNAVEVWARYPAAFDGFAMPVCERFEGRNARTAVVAIVNRGRQRAQVGGIADAAGQMAAPHLFVVTLNEAGLIARVQVWCDQATLYRQLEFPAGFAAERAA